MRKYMIVIGLMAAIMLGAGCSKETEEMLVDETLTVEEYSYRGYEISVDDYTNIDVDIQVTNGGSVDVLFMDQTSFSQWKDTTQDSISFYQNYSALNVKSKSYSVELPKGTYEVIVNDGYRLIENGATPEGHVDVKIKIVGH